MAASRWIGGTSKPYVFNAITKRPRGKELVVVAKCRMEGHATMERITLNVFFGEKITPNEATAISVDLMCSTLVFWLRKLEANTGERYYNMVMNSIEELYLEPGEDDPDIQVEYED